MHTPLIIENTITIDAPATKVWDILTNPEQTKKYMHGCEAISEWQPGSPLLWNAVWEGAEMTFVKGHVVDIQPGKYLAYTTFAPNGAIDDIPENYATVTYSLEENNGQTILSVTQGDFATIANGAKKYFDAMTEGGWDSLLEEIRIIATE